jgi:hypothetical protein
LPDTSSTGTSAHPGIDGVNTDTAETPRSPEQLRDELVETTAAQAPDIADLIRMYYRLVPAEELLGDSPTDLIGAVRSHVELARKRVPGRSVVRLFNPNIEHDGWARESTVVQVVTDDMPYLVDSVVAELARSGVQVQRIVHPIVVVNRDVTGALEEIYPKANVATPTVRCRRRVVDVPGGRSDRRPGARPGTGQQVGQGAQRRPRGRRGHRQDDAGGDGHRHSARGTATAVARGGGVRGCGVVAMAGQRGTSCSWDTATTRWCPSRRAATNPCCGPFWPPAWGCFVRTVSPPVTSSTAPTPLRAC